MDRPAGLRHNRGVRVLDDTAILDRQQLRAVTLDDAELMREVLDALLDDTSRQITSLAAAIRNQNPEETKRLAHYCKGACANLGANAVAAVLRRLEQEASRADFAECMGTLGALRREMARLEAEIGGAARHTHSVRAHHLTSPES